MNSKNKLPGRWSWLGAAALAVCAQAAAQPAATANGFEPLRVASAREAIAVVYRAAGVEGPPVVVTLNDRLVGSLLPGQFVQSRACPGDRLAVQVVERPVAETPAYQKLGAAPGETLYLQIVPTADRVGWMAQRVDTSAAQQVLKSGAVASHLVSRYAPE